MADPILSLGFIVFACVILDRTRSNDQDWGALYIHSHVLDFFRFTLVHFENAPLFCGHNGRVADLATNLLQSLVS